MVIIQGTLAAGGKERGKYYPEEASASAKTQCICSYGRVGFANCSFKVQPTHVNSEYHIYHILYPGTLAEAV